MPVNLEELVAVTLRNSGYDSSHRVAATIVRRAAVDSGDDREEIVRKLTVAIEEYKEHGGRKVARP